MDLYLIRHGRTVFNQEDRHQYSTTPLAKEGVEAAHKLATRLSDIHFDTIYTSPMTRAIQTAQILSKTWDQKAIELDDLREQKHPSVLEGKSKHEPAVQEVKNARLLHRADPDWHHSDEENYWDVRNRILGLQQLLVTKHKEDELILGVSHGVCIKMFVATVIFGGSVTPDEFLHVYNHTITSNTGITHVRYTAKEGWMLVTLNDDAHL